MTDPLDTPEGREEMRLALTKQMREQSEWRRKRDAGFMNMFMDQLGTLIKGKKHEDSVQ